MRKALNRFFRQEANKRVLKQDRLFRLLLVLIKATDERKRSEAPETAEGQQTEDLRGGFNSRPAHYWENNKPYQIQGGNAHENIINYQP